MGEDLEEPEINKTAQDRFEERVALTCSDAALGSGCSAGSLGSTLQGGAAVGRQLRGLLLRCLARAIEASTGLEDKTALKNGLFRSHHDEGLAR
ncbi:hypothetical protein ACFYZJ_32300 [Streptomyces sp. NPDC001848]|uniref:hypothetical protein n=1 Tax=Streptomyces sp. NPDC001848 TaxID=3364618 RepID=UPI0036D0C0CB